MKNFIRKKLIEGINGIQTPCNTMSVATWSDGYKLIVSAIGTPEQNPKMWDKIKIPVNNWKNAEITINSQIKTTNMSGDSMVDESNTWWATIQSTICQ